MEAFLLAYIALRMKEMGFNDYTFEPIRVTTDTVNATNEYYYLISPTIESPSLVIKSDTNIFNESASYNKFNLYGLQEFTGQIQLIEADTVTYPLDYEFIRVIPRIPLDAEVQKVVEEYQKHVKL